METPVLEQDEIDFLNHSNWIEHETSGDALDDAVSAWWYLKPLYPLKAKHLLQCHALLMLTRDLDPRAKGEWTKVQTRVGPRINPPPFRVPALVDAFLEALDENVRFHRDRRDERSDEWRESDAKNFHVKFEKIHGFQDGNGRIGRILYNWHRLRIGLPIHVIREEDRAEYYEWFR